LRVDFVEQSKIGALMDAEKYNLEITEKYMKYINPGLMRLVAFMGFDKVEVSSDGSIIRDNLGNEYIDCLGGFGVYSLGHRHPKIIAAMKEQLEKIPFPSKVLLNEPLALLAEKLAEITPGKLQYTFVCNSGTEATEGALKIARLAKGKPGVIYTDNSFHGKTLGSLSVTGREKYQKMSRPLLPGMKLIPFNDADALNDTIDKDTACFIVEPIQGEGGINIPSNDYLPRVREICDKKGILLILDEVQTGLGRSGKLFACNHWDVAPDILTLAKALGGGVMPIGAIIGTPEVWTAFDENPLIHSSTFGGNELASRVALEALKVIIEEKLPQQAQEKGEWFIPKIKKIASEYGDLVEEVRGIGLFIGVDFKNDDIGNLFLSALAARKVIVAFALNSAKVIRIEPPLNIPKELLEIVLVKFRESLEEVRTIIKSMD
jgi:putrescine aminotransferase